MNVLHVYYEKVFSYRLPESSSIFPPSWAGHGLLSCAGRSSKAFIVLSTAVALILGGVPGSGDLGFPTLSETVFPILSLKNYWLSFQSFTNTKG